MSVFLYQGTGKNTVKKIKTKSSKVNMLLATGEWYPSKDKALAAYKEQKLKEWKEMKKLEKSEDPKKVIESNKSEE